MGQFKRKDGYALMGAVMAQLTGEDSYSVIDAQGFADAGKLAMEYKTDEIFNALSIVGAKLMISARPYKAPLWLIDSINSGVYNNLIREISYYSTKPLPTGAFNTATFTNFADGYDNGTNSGNSTADQWEQHPVHPLELNFSNSTVWQDCLTKYNNQIKIAFTNEDEWARFWGGVLTEKGNDIEQQKEAHNRVTLLSRMALSGAMGEDDSALAPLSTVIDLTSAFNSEFGTNYTGAELRTTYLDKFLPFLVTKVKEISRLMTRRSVAFHAAPVLNLSDGDHYILRNTPKSEQKMMIYSSFWDKAEAYVMPKVFNDEYLDIKNFEAVDYWQAFSLDGDEKAGINFKTTIPGWLEDLIADTTGSSDTAYTFNPDYVLGCIFDNRALMTDFHLEDARTTNTEARKNYSNTWFDFGKGAICNPTHNFVLFVMSAGEEPGPGPEPEPTYNTTKEFEGDSILNNNYLISNDIDLSKPYVLTKNGTVLNPPLEYFVGSQGYENEFILTFKVATTDSDEFVFKFNTPEPST